MGYYSERLRHTLFESPSPALLTSSSSRSRSSATRLASRSLSPLCLSESSPRLRGTSFLLSSSSSNSSFSSSSSSSSAALSTPAAAIGAGGKTRKKKRTRKLLAEEQELLRIMDPTYLGQQQQQRPQSNNLKARWEEEGCGYHADPQGYWHDIDYRPFARIKEKSRQPRTWTSPSSYPTPFSLSSSLYDGEDKDILPFGKKGSKTAGESLAYWETFTVGDPGSRTIEDGHLDDGDGDGDGRVGYTTLRPRVLPSWSYYHYPPLDSDDCDEVDNSINGKDKGDKRRVLLKKKGSKQDNDSFNSQDSFSSASSSEWSSTSSSDIDEQGDVTHKISKPKPKSLNPTGLRRTWVTTTFIARLKVIRTKRWLKERIVLCS